MTKGVSVDDLSAAARKLLNYHGEAFQYAVIREALRLQGENKSTWAFEAAQFPVSVNGRVTHIDIILCNQDRSSFLVCECKRVRMGHGARALFGAP